MSRAADLLGRSPGVTRCDHCGRAFQPDDGYVAYWVTPCEELHLLEEIQREQSGTESDPTRNARPDN